MHPPEADIEVVLMWSSQRYSAVGREKGVDGALLKRASTAIENFIDRNPKLPPLLTLGHLAQRSCVSWYWLRRYVEGAPEAYSHFRIRKRSGGHRVISVPEEKLKIVQRWIAAHILKEMPVHAASYAFAKDSSIVACARQHCNARWLVKMDVSAFFGSISAIQVYRVFLDAGYSRLVAFELAQICTHAPDKSVRYNQANWEWWPVAGAQYPYNKQRIGYLPQGAPTSPMISNLVMRETDAEITKIARDAGLTYTRYSDDITFSTTEDFDRTKAMSVVRATTAVLRAIGLTVNEKKTKIVPPGARKIVLGLLVDGNEPKLTKEFRDSLRQHLYYAAKFGPAAHRNRRGFDSVAGLYRHLRGLVDFAKSVDPAFHAEMRAELNAIAWSLDETPMSDPE